MQINEQKKNNKNRKSSPNYHIIHFIISATSFFSLKKPYKSDKISLSLTSCISIQHLVLAHHNGHIALIE